MSFPLMLACFWAIVANVIALTPSKDHHWKSAYMLIAVGIPIVGAVTWYHGPWLGLLVLAAGCSVLRWPLVYLGRWIRRGGGPTVAESPAE